MSLLRWMRCSMRFALLCLSFQYQRTDGNKTIPQLNCTCLSHEGIYNLASLQRYDGKPRFTTPGSGQWVYSYNPCGSFSLGNCFGDDVAVCMWSDNQASFSVIGNQSTFFCGYDRQFKKPQLEYSNKQFPVWKVIIRLHCNPKLKTIGQAKFEAYGHEDLNTTRQFILTHKCACPDGCPEDSGTATVTPAPIKLSKAGKIGLIVGVSTAGVIIIIAAVILVIWIYRRRHQDINPRRFVDNFSETDDNSENSGASASAPAWG